MPLMHRHIFCLLGLIALGSAALSPSSASAHQWGERTIISLSDRTIVREHMDRSYWRKYYYLPAPEGRYIAVDTPADYEVQSSRRIWARSRYERLRIHHPNVRIRAPYVDIYVPR